MFDMIVVLNFLSPVVSQFIKKYTRILVLLKYMTEIVFCNEEYIFTFSLFFSRKKPSDTKLQHSRRKTNKQTR